MEPIVQRLVISLVTILSELVARLKLTILVVTCVLIGRVEISHIVRVDFISVRKWLVRMHMIFKFVVRKIIIFVWRVVVLTLNLLNFQEFGCCKLFSG